MRNIERRSSREPYAVKNPFLAEFRPAIGIHLLRSVCLVYTYPSVIQSVRLSVCLFVYQFTCVDCRRQFFVSPSKLI